MPPKKGADHARVTLGACGSGVPLVSEGRAPRLSPPTLRLRGPPGAGPPCLLAPSLALFALVDLGLGTWLASPDHRPPDALPCGLRVSPGPTEVQVWVGRGISERHVGDSPCRRGPAATCVLPVGVAAAHEVPVSSGASAGSWLLSAAGHWALRLAGWADSPLVRQPGPPRCPCACPGATPGARGRADTQTNLHKGRGPCRAGVEA